MTTDFTSLNLREEVAQAITELGYSEPTPIQSALIPIMLSGKDVIGQAQTGTGKTAAFALPILQNFTSQRHVQALVLAPTRELALQVADSMIQYGKHMDVRVLAVYGGQPYGPQISRLNRGVDVVVGTPGRLLDLIERNALNIKHVRTVVLDEADEMLNMGFIEDVEKILAETPEDRQTALFSATMQAPILEVARRHMREPVEVRIRAKTATVESINQRCWMVSGVHKLDALTRILETEEFDAMIIFVRTKTATAELAEKLEARGYSSAALNGDMNQAQREQTIDRFKRGTLDIVVATDVAARGLGGDRISHVVD